MILNTSILIPIKKIILLKIIKYRYYFLSNIYYFSKKNIVSARFSFKNIIFSFLVLCNKILLSFIKPKNEENFKGQLTYKFPENLNKPKFSDDFGFRIFDQSKLYKVKNVDNNWASFKINTSENPLVSIVIPVCNSFEYTYNCLLSISNIFKNTSLQVEIIVVNDCSTDQTVQYLKNIEGIKVINNIQNIGFLKSCNEAIKLVKGEFVVLLNNDTQVIDDFITPLLDVFKLKKDAGAVGGKLIYPSGLLQEAGAHIYQQGEASNFGRLEHPENWEYNYLKIVDYCSAALLMFKREDWNKVGGFDERYFPCYYEDTDFCFAIKHLLGLQVYYTPFSQIIHFEGISNGVNVADGLKNNQLINKSKFYDKWKKQLENYPIYDEKSLKVPFQDLLKSTKPSILIVYPHIPEFDKDSGGNRLTQILIILSEMADVYLYVNEYSVTYKTSYAKQLQENGVRIIYRHDTDEENCHNFANIIKNNFTYIWSTGSNFYLAEKYFDIAKQSKSKIIYDTVDLLFVRYEREFELTGIRNIANDRIKERELLCIKTADLCFAISDVELAIIKELGIEKAYLLSNIHQSRNISGLKFENRKDILFIGGFNHAPNIDAVIWLKEQIMPLVWDVNPSITVNIVGSNPPKEILNLQADNFIIHGFIEDVTTFFTSNTLFVCPLRYGAGVKGKIGQSLEYNLPIITTSIGAEGMGLEHTESAWICDEKESFANAIIDLYSNEAKWQVLHKNSSKVLDKFSPEMARITLQKLVEGKLL